MSAFHSFPGPDGRLQPKELIPADFVSNLNVEFGFGIPASFSGIRRQLTPEEDCCRLIPALWRRSPTAVYQCVEHLRGMDPLVGPVLLTKAFRRFLLRQMEIEVAKLAASRLTHSFDTFSDPRLAQPRDVSTIVGGYDGDTEIADSDDEAPGPTTVPERSPIISPPGPGEHWHSHRLPYEGLFVESMADCPQLLKAPFPVRFECSRIAAACNIDLSRIESKYAERIATASVDRGNSTLNPDSTNAWRKLSVLQNDLAPLTSGAPLPQPLTDKDVWDAALSKSPSVNISARLKYENSKGGGVFRLQPLRLEMEATSRRFFRKFGSHRFLSVKVPDLGWRLDHLPKDKNPLPTRLLEWLASDRPKLFAGNRYELLYTRPVKDRRRASAKQTTDAPDAYEVLFFATEGPGLEHISVQGLVSWFMPLNLNLNAPFAKSYARLELAMSSTYPSLQFEPGQIHYVQDVFSDATPEDTRFDDPSLCHMAGASSQHSRVMNDGCSRISHAAAVKVWACVPHDQSDGLPSAFQARIGPAKGVWMVESMHHADNGSDRYGKIWIEISSSQKKFEPHAEDTNATSGQYDPHRLTFDVHSWPKRPSPSKLYKEFFPILEHRGVPRKSLENSIESSMQDEFTTVENCTADKQLFAFWLQQQRDARATDVFSHWPRALEEQLQRLVQAGFQPEKSSHVANLFSTVLKTRLSKLCVELQADCACSVFALGVADPYRCLAPGQIHLYFSGSVQLSDGHEGPLLHNVKALVARHPALRPSDMQKISLVYKPELRHLINVAVFPTTGRVPLASKLQGGDYDGDRFWICWEPALVRSFKNAPAPVTNPDPMALGIEQDTRTLGQILSDGQVKNLVEQGASLQLKEQLLGIVTDAHTKISYAILNMTSPLLDQLADLHDLLVDSAKNGYSFGREEWRRRFTSQFSVQVRGKLREPAWKMIASSANNAPDIFGPLESLCYKKEHIIDHLVFDVARPLCQAFYKAMDEKMTRTATHSDLDLEHVFRSVASQAVEVPSLMRKVAVNAEDDIKKMLRSNWKPWLWREERLSVAKIKRLRYTNATDKLRTAFRRLQPRTSRELGDQTVAELFTVLTAQYGWDFSRWDLIKASAFFCACLQLHRNAGPSFEVAGNALCYLKVNSAGHECAEENTQRAAMPAHIGRDVLGYMKVRKVTAQAVEPEHDADGDTQMTTEDDDQDDGHDLGRARAREEAAELDEYLSQMFGSSMSQFPG